MIEHIYPLIIGPVAAVLVETAKRVPIIPFSGQQRAAVVAALLVASLAIRAALAWVQGDLTRLDWATELRIVLDAATGVFVAAGGYSLLKR